MTMRTLFLFFVSVFFSFVGLSQGYTKINKESIIRNEFKKAAEKYKSSDAISFDLEFYCYSDSKLNIVIDSLKGNCVLRKNEFWYKIANTEFISDSNFDLTVFHDDKIFFISPKSTDLKSFFSPQVLDSFLVKYSNKIALEQNNSFNFFSITIDSSGYYNNLRIKINRNTQLLEEIKVDVDAKFLYDPEDQNKVEPGTIVSIIIQYKNYRNSSEFEGSGISKFLLMSEDKLSPTESYKDYQIMNNLPTGK